MANLNEKVSLEGKQRLINCCPYPIRVQVGNMTQMTIPASLGPIPRVDRRYSKEASIEIENGDGFIIHPTISVRVYNMPKTNEGIMYIVPQEVANAGHNRHDLLYPEYLSKNLIGKVEYGSELVWVNPKINDRRGLRYTEPHIEHEEYED